ncbi:hypothetical protein C7M61_001602 [Candidozyma pseudohaemuli]|uniref:Uncharacterized protein n=1 Tax=Candidozyma pseudohaemuli TaxID=418784 RepID=A0A2P7YV04_9ASCO|nr:hypothetical protein C7M61_001602 [[Candida] pseudohaemulonii]PSK39794.1 hypothetical protein C7M61_001602 [[Candida] pseudohaemulonii]
MFKKIFRPPSSRSKKEIEKSLFEKGPTIRVTSLTDSDLQRYREDNGLSDTKCDTSNDKTEKKECAKNFFSGIDPSDITIEDLDPYADKNRVRRSRSFTLPPSKPPSAFKLPRSKTVHFADQSESLKRFRKRVSEEESSLVYSDESADLRGVHGKVQERLTGIFKEEDYEFKAAEEEDAKPAEGSTSVEVAANEESSGSPLDEELTVREKEVEELPYMSSGDSISPDMADLDVLPDTKDWDHTIYVSCDENGRNITKQLSDLYQKHFPGTNLDFDDLGELIISIDSGIGDSIQQNKFCQSLLASEKKRANDAEADVEAWKQQFDEINSKYEELNDIQTERQNRLEGEIEHILEKSSKELEASNEVIKDLRDQLRANSERCDDQKHAIEALTEKEGVLMKQKESLESDLSKAFRENESLKKAIEEIKNKLLEDLKANSLRVIDLKSENNDLKHSLDATNQDREALWTTKVDLERKLQDYIIKIESLGTAEKECKATIRQKEALIAEKVSIIKNFESNAQKHEEVSEALTRKNLELKIGLETCQTEKSNFEARVKELGRKVDDGSKELKEVESKNLEALKQLRDLFNKQQEKAAQSSKKLEIKELERKLLDQKVVDLNAEVLQLKKEVKTRRANFHTCFDGFETMKWSNNFTVETMKKLLKSTYEAMAPFLAREAASANAQLYYEVNRILVFSKDNQTSLTELTTALIESSRQVSREYAETLEALRVERKGRAESQRESMAVIRRLARTNRRMQKASRQIEEILIPANMPAGRKITAMLHPCGNSQSEGNLVDWWSIMGSKANQTYAIAQLLQSPSPQNISSESTESNNDPPRKRDKLRSWWPWKKAATETPTHSVNTNESNGASGRKQNTLKSQRTFADSLAQSSAFKIPFADFSTNVVVKDNEQLFFASGDTVIAMDLTSPAHNFKLLNLGNSHRINSIQLNHTHSLLALICRRCIIVVCLKRIPFLEPNQSWEPLKFVINLSSDVQSVSWHPASYSATDLVVLTKDKLQLFDIIKSTTKAKFDEKLEDLALRETPISIAFGSALSLSGSLSLYYSTASGHIYSLFPFIYPGFHLGASKSAVDLFVSETQELVSMVEGKFPPRVIAGHPSNNDLLVQLNFGLDLQNQIESPLLNSSDPYKVLRLKHLPMDPLVSGPYAKVAANSLLTSLDTNTAASVILAHHDSESQFEMTYLAQLSPLVMSSAFDIPRPDAPQHPSALQAKKDNDKYVKPKKGFGLAFASDDELDDEANTNSQFVDYSKAWEIYELKIKCQDFILLHQKLTSLSVEQYKKNSPGAASVIAQTFGRLLLCVKDKVQVVDCLQWFGELEDGFPLGVAEFYSEKTTFSVEKPLTAIALIHDVGDPSDPYLFMRSLGGEIVVAQVYPGDGLDDEAEAEDDSPQVHDKFDAKTVHDIGISANELKRMLKYPHSAQTTFSSKTRNAEDLITLSKISDVTRAHIHQLSKFIIALVGKLEVQQKRNLMHSSLLDGDKPIEEFKQRIPMYTKRIEELLARQEHLLKRGNDIESKVIKRFEDSKRSASLPISHKERAWMIELNGLTRNIIIGTPEKVSLEKQVKKLDSIIREVRQKEEDTSDLEGSMKELLLHNNLHNVVQHMHRQGRIIEIAKERLQADVERVDALVEV